MREIEIVSAAEFARRSVVVPPAFELRFPRCWRAQPVQNRYAASIEEETLRWLKSYGIGCTPEEALKLRAFECSSYGGYSLPLADFRSGLLVTEFIALWLFWDDVQVEEEFGWSTDSVVSALAGHVLSEPSSRYVAAWADLGARLRRTQSEAWLVRLAASMRQWLENARRETSMAKAWQTEGVCPELDTLFDCRTISIGMFPTFYLIEFAEGFELDDAVHCHPTIVELKRLASRLVGMGNDLGGLAKDSENDWLNLVLVLAERCGLTMEAAFERLVCIHNADVKAFDALVERIPSFGPASDLLVRGWVRAVRYNVYGFALWESTARRYQARKVVAGNRALVAPVTTTMGRLPRKETRQARVTARP
jgi:hypothetical protein